ncbi:MAG: hypothetical protein LUC33_07220 [Prevotellaceae bacterium]|nr:hypothetical protein [Prevotellaceae bacterium]
MKKHLSLFCALACLGLAAPVCAQVEAEGMTATTWAEPTVSAPTGSDLTDGSSYYLYNVEAGMFLVNGDKWQTEASFGSTGLNVKLDYSDDQSGYSLTVTSDFSGTWTNGSISNTNVYCISESSIWVDLRSSQDGYDTYYGNDNMYFDIEGVEGSENVYTIKSHLEGVSYLGYDGETTVVSGTLEDASDANAQWLLVSSDDYTTYQNAVTLLKSVDRTYLNNALTDALALGLDGETNFTEAVKAYENAASTQTEIDAATAALASLIQEKGTASGEVIVYDDNCYRVIGKNLITNPSFEYGYTGWTSGTGATITSPYFVLYDDGGAADGDLYLYGIGESQNGGSSSAYALKEGWSLEKDKTYYFGYDTKALKSSTTTQTWAYTSLTNTLGTETSMLIKDPTISADWSTVGIVFTNSDDYSYLQIMFRWMGEYYLDNFRLCEVELLQEEDEDVTDTYIKNADCTSTSTGDWTETPSTNFEDKTKGFIHATSTDTPTNWFEGWVDQSTGTFTDRSLTQTISLPAGEYRLSADIVATRQNETLDNVSGVYLFAGENDSTSVYTPNTWSNFSVDFAVEAEAGQTAEVTIGLKTESTDANWVGVTNFKLLSLGDEQTYAICELAKLISSASDLVAEAGTGADDLQAAIDEAQAVLTAAENTDALESAISSLKVAMEIYNLKNDKADLLGVWVPVAESYSDFSTYTGITTSPSLINYYSGDSSFFGAEEVVKQTLTGLPDGVYEVEVYCVANLANNATQTNNSVTPNQDEVVVIAANGIEQKTTYGTKSASDITSIDNVGVYTLSNVIVEDDGKISLSISVTEEGCVNWILVETKSVTYVSELPTLDDLQDAIDAAEEAYVNVGEDAFQIPETTTEAAAVAEALKTANELVEKGDDATSAAILAAIQTLEADVEEFTEGIPTYELNTPSDGQVFNVTMADEGLSWTGKAIEYSGSSNDGGYGFAFTADINPNMGNQIFSFNATTSTDVTVNAYTISFDDADGTTHYLCTVYDLDNSNNNTASIRSTTDADKALVFQIKATTTEGVWNIYNHEASENIGTQGDTGLFTTTNTTKHNALAITEAPSEIEWTLQAEYGTLVLPFAPDATEIEGLTFYSTEAYDTEDEDEEDGKALLLVEVEADDLEANTPYIVSGDADTYTFAVTARVYPEIDGTTTTIPTATAGWLTGVYESTTVEQSNYVLQNGSEGLAFYAVASDDIELGANHCYLSVSEEGASGGDAPAVILLFPASDGTETAITGVEAETETGTEAVYDLSGRKVSQPVKGIYIKGGKKVLVK